MGSGLPPARITARVKLHPRGEHDPKDPQTHFWLSLPCAATLLPLSGVSSRPFREPGASGSTSMFPSTPNLEGCKGNGGPSKGDLAVVCFGGAHGAHHNEVLPLLPLRR